MSGVNKGLLQNCWQLQRQIVRFKSKINITKPRPLHFKREVVERLCVPYFSLKKRPTHIPDYEKCDITEKKEELVNPFEVILGREVLNWFNHSQMVAFFHENKCEEEDEFENKFVFKKHGMKYLKYEKEVMEKGLTNTIYEPVLVLYQSHTIIAVSNQADIHTLLNVNKKLPTLSLMAAIIDKRLFSYSELEHYGRFANLEAAQVNLVGELNKVPQTLVQRISHHPFSIVQLLNQHKELIKKE